MSAMKLLTEDLISLSQAAREIPRPEGSKPIHVATCWRWTRRGLRGVQLETVMIGQQSFTTRQALTRFLVATQESTLARAEEEART